MHLFNIWNENQLMSLFYSYIAGSLHVSGPQAHLQESSYSCSHNHWFSICVDLFVCSVCCDNTQSTRTERHRNWNNGCANSCTNSPEDGPVDPKHVEIQQYMNKIVTSVGFHSICYYWLFSHADVSGSNPVLCTFTTKLTLFFEALLPRFND